jgi:two-component system response regulator MprA
LEKPELLTFQDLVLDLRHRAVRRNGREIPLTTREFDLLETFMRQPRRVFPKDQLIDLVWGRDAEVTTNAVETYVSYLRTKIDAPGLPSLIATVRGIGYSLRARER